MFGVDVWVLWVMTVGEERLHNERAVVEDGMSGQDGCGGEETRVTIERGVQKFGVLEEGRELGRKS